MEPSALAWAVLVISVTGFLYLASWIRGVTTKVEDITKKLITNEDILNELKQIKLALLGTYDKVGLVTLAHATKEELEAMRKKCEKNHDS
jgi:hypothetical protein